MWKLKKHKKLEVREMAKQSRKKQSYRLDVNASICLSVIAESEDEAIKLAEELILSYSNGLELEDGEGYTDAVVYTSTEESAEVVDVEDLQEVKP